MKQKRIPHIFGQLNQHFFSARVFGPKLFLLRNDVAGDIFLSQ